MSGITVDVKPRGGVASGNCLGNRRSLRHDRDAKHFHDQTREKTLHNAIEAMENQA